MSDSLSLWLTCGYLELQAADSFAVVQVGGKQFRVVKGDVIVTDKLVGAPVGETIVLEKVLLYGKKDFTAVGKPLLTKSKVYCTSSSHLVSCLVESDPTPL